MAEAESENTTIEEPRLPCRKCQRTFASRSGRWRHESVCMHESPSSGFDTSDTSLILNSIQDLGQKLQTHLRKYEALLQTVHPTLHSPTDPADPADPADPLTHTLTDHINHILNYLNTHCKEALTVEEFIDRTHFTVEDHGSIDKSRYYLNGVEDLLTKHLMAVPFEKRPIHCTPCVTKRPSIYFVKNNGEWVYEAQTQVEFMFNHGQFSRGESGMKTIDLIVEYTHKLQDDCRNIPNTHPNPRKYIEKMENITSSTHRIDLLYNLCRRNFMAIRVGPDHTIEIVQDQGEYCIEFTQLPL